MDPSVEDPDVPVDVSAACLRGREEYGKLTPDQKEELIDSALAVGSLVPYKPIALTCDLVGAVRHGLRLKDEWLDDKRPQIDLKTEIKTVVPTHSIPPRPISRNEAQQILNRVRECEDVAQQAKRQVDRALEQSRQIVLKKTQAATKEKPLRGQPRLMPQRLLPPTPASPPPPPAPVSHALSSRLMDRPVRDRQIHTQVITEVTAVYTPTSGNTQWNPFGGVNFTTPSGEVLHVRQEPPPEVAALLGPKPAHPATSLPKGSVYFNPFTGYVETA